jgi:hypothetical protein
MQPFLAGMALPIRTKDPQHNPALKWRTCYAASVRPGRSWGSGTDTPPQPTQPSRHAALATLLGSPQSSQAGTIGPDHWSVARDGGPQPPPEVCQPRSCVEGVQVRDPDAAVRAAEALDRDHGSRHPADDRRPDTLASLQVVAELGLLDFQEGREVIDVPVFPPRSAQVPGQFRAKERIS